VVDDARGELCTAALAAAARGWRVFPLRPSDKRPAVRNWEHRATHDGARITRCWAAGPYNVGIACGPSGLVVIDLDAPKPGATRPRDWDLPGVTDGEDVLAVLAERAGQPMPAATFTVGTVNGGRHLYFAAPAGPPLRNTAGRLGWLVDTRAHGGYVVGPGSVVDGRPYALLHDVPPAALPTWLAASLADPAIVRREADHDFGDVVERVGRRSAYAARALLGEVERVLAAQPGTRNQTLNTAAFALGQLAAAGLLPEDLAAEALIQAGQTVGLSSRECATTVRSGMTSGARTPRRFTA
jgi:hypothetical protein